MNRFVFFLILFCCVALYVHAQQNSDTTRKSPLSTRSDQSLKPIKESAALQDSLTYKLQPYEDSVVSKKIDSLQRPEWVTPKKVAFYSAICPGLGQIYNKHYWKLPIIYGLVGVAGYFFYDNMTNYNKYREVYVAYLSGDRSAMERVPYLSTIDQVKSAQDYYRTNLETTVLIAVLGYGLQIMDAVIFAHLKNFDISDDITLKFQPTIMPNGNFGIGLAFKFK